jgi:diguanylate cyclase (GGDEF)-like protein
MDTRFDTQENRNEPSRRHLLELTGRDFPEREARRHVLSIERRRRELSRVLGREVRLELAALDYLTSGPAPIAPDLRLMDGAALDRLQGLTRTDSLTGVLNRRGLEPVLEREAARAARTGAPLSLLAVDLDEFKRVNDRHGHPWGDRVLARVADLLQRHCRASDAVARLGGDEFVLVLPDTSLEGARVLAERILSATAGADLLGGCPTRIAGERVTISIGIACGSEAPRDLVARADSALYQAKRAGRDRVGAA